MSKVSRSQFLYRVSTRTHTMMPLLKASSLRFCSGCCIRQRPLTSAPLSLLPLSSSCYPALTMMNFQPNFGLWLFNVFPSFFAGSKINIYEYFNFHLGQHPPPQAQQAQLRPSSILDRLGWGYSCARVQEDSLWLQLWQWRSAGINSLGHATHTVIYSNLFKRKVALVIFSSFVLSSIQWKIEIILKFVGQRTHPLPPTTDCRQASTKIQWKHHKFSLSPCLSLCFLSFFWGGEVLFTDMDENIRRSNPQPAWSIPFQMKSIAFSTHPASAPVESRNCQPQNTKIHREAARVEIHQWFWPQTSQKQPKIRFMVPC